MFYVNIPYSGDIPIAATLPVRAAIIPTVPTNSSGNCLSVIKPFSYYFEFIIPIKGTVHFFLQSWVSGYLIYRSYVKCHEQINNNTFVSNFSSMPTMSRNSKLSSKSNPLPHTLSKLAHDTLQSLQLKYNWTNCSDPRASFNNPPSTDPRNPPDLNPENSQSAFQQR